MLKIGIIGLGDIARKAYLPVITSRPIEIHLCSRNKNAVLDASAKYRLTHTHSTIESLIKAKVDAAFVHTATAAHDQVVRQLLTHGIHVYVDKPVTDRYNSTKDLFELATANNLLLETGFNRRFAPAYANLRNVKDISMIVMQKNRKSLPGEIRAFVFDDFIHVIDTLLFLFPTKEKKLIVQGMKKGNLLYHVMIQLTSPSGETAIGIMNRDSGTIEERLEVFSPTGKWVVDNVAESYLLLDKQVIKTGGDDWLPTLSKRGFDQIVDSFINAVASGKASSEITHSLETHRICEEVVTQLQAL